MIINGILFNADLETILGELVNQLRLNDISYIQKMKSSGGDIQVCCPYHKGGAEKRPSAGIRKSDGLFHCLTCGETHSLQEVISYCFGYEDDMIGAFGWKWLIKNFATVEVEDRQDVRLDLERNKDSRKYRSISNSLNSGDIINNAIYNNNTVTNQYVTEAELNSYRYYHPYWAKRGITDEKIIELFDLGYSPQEKMITFPNLDKDGNCLFVAKRSVKFKYFHYPANVTKHIYGIYQLYQLDKFPNDVYITESMIDCLLLWQIGKYACAMNGLGNEVQFKELREMPCRKFILSTDSDGAGIKARERIKSKVRNKLLTEIILPKGRKDIGECTEYEIKNLVEVF